MVRQAGSSTVGQQFCFKREAVGRFWNQVGNCISWHSSHVGGSCQTMYRSLSYCLGVSTFIVFILALHLHLVWMRVVIDACWVASAVWQLSLERNAGLPGNRMLGSDGFSGRMLPRTLSIATALGAVLINDLATLYACTDCTWNAIEITSQYGLQHRACLGASKQVCCRLSVQQVLYIKELY